MFHPGLRPEFPECAKKGPAMSYGPPRRPIPRSGIIGSAIAGVLVLVGIVFAALSCSGPSTPSAAGPTTTLVPVTVVPTPVTVAQAPPATVEITPVYTPPVGVNAGSGGAADPDEGALDTGTVVLLLGGALLVLGGGIAMARRRAS
jgi:hypothetical protein